MRADDPTGRPPESESALAEPGEPASATDDGLGGVRRGRPWVLTALEVPEMVAKWFPGGPGHCMIRRASGIGARNRLTLYAPSAPTHQGLQVDAAA